MRPLYRLLKYLSLALLIFLLYFGVALPLMFAGHPYSSYFELKKSNETLSSRAAALNRERLLSSKLYFKEQVPKDNLEQYQQVHNSRDIYLAIAVITVRRSKTNDNYGYILQSLSGLDTFAKSPEFSRRTYLFVCNVDPEPELHKKAQFLKSYVPFVERYGTSSFTNETFKFGRDELYREKTHSNTYEKETYDYSFCLQAAHSLNPKFILVAQDDAVPHKDLSQVLKFTLEKRLMSDGQPRRFAYLKLYYPEKWLGFSFELDRIFEIISIGIVGAGVGLLVQHMLCLSRSRACWTYLLSIAVGATFFVTSAELSGRQNVMELRRFSNQLYMLRPAFGCCIPAQLYPTQFIDPLTAYLTSTNPKDKHVDIAIPAFFKERGIPEFQLEPNLFYHIGYHSSLSDLDKNPKHFLIDIKR